MHPKIYPDETISPLMKLSLYLSSQLVCDITKDADVSHHLMRMQISLRLDQVELESLQPLDYKKITQTSNDLYI